MADTRNVLEEQLRKTGNKVPVELPWQLLIFSFAILGLILASYFGMIFGYQPYLNSQISAVNAQIKESEKTVNSEQRTNLTNIYSQLTNIRDLLDSHVIASNLFDELEKGTYPQIYYTSLSFSLVEKRLDLQGVSQDYTTLIKQLDYFRSNQLFGDAVLNNAKSTADGISFSIRINLSPDNFK
ncbi:MAG: PilN domain-containing protein [Candidatus Paceibacterota bacterium]